MARRASVFIISFLATLAAFLLAFAGHARGQAIGYGRFATGAGPNAPRCLVHDEATFRACVGKGGQLVVPTAGVRLYPGLRRIAFASNTTVEGGGLIVLVADWVGFSLDDVHNIVVRGVVAYSRGLDLFPDLKPPQNCANPVAPSDVEGCGVMIGIAGASTDIWIDRSTFARCGNKCVTVWATAAPGQRAIAPDRITISNSRFVDSYFAILIGVDNTLTADRLPATPGHVTITGNLFSRIFRRAPRCAGGYLCHVFNNWNLYFGKPGGCAGATWGFGPSAVAGAKMLLEQEAITPWPAPACQNAIDTEDEDGRGLGIVSSSPAATFQPDYPYAASPAQQAANALAKTAGAKP